MYSFIFVYFGHHTHIHVHIRVCLWRRACARLHVRARVHMRARAYTHACVCTLKHKCMRSRNCLSLVGRYLGLKDENDTHTRALNDCNISSNTHLKPRGISTVFSTNIYAIYISEFMSVCVHRRKRCIHM